MAPRLASSATVNCGATCGWPVRCARSLMSSSWRSRPGDPIVSMFDWMIPPTIGPNWVAGAIERWR